MGGVPRCSISDKQWVLAMPLGHAHILNDKVFKCLSRKVFLRPFSPSLCLIRGEWLQSLAKLGELTAGIGSISTPAPTHTSPSMPLHTAPWLLAVHSVDGLCPFLSDSKWTGVLVNFVAGAVLSLKAPVIWMSIAAIQHGSLLCDAFKKWTWVMSEVWISRPKVARNWSWSTGRIVRRHLFYCWMNPFERSFILVPNEFQHPSVWFRALLMEWDAQN